MTFKERSLDAWKEKQKEFQGKELIRREENKRRCIKAFKKLGIPLSESDFTQGSISGRINVEGIEFEYDFDTLNYLCATPRDQIWIFYYPVVCSGNPCRSPGNYRQMLPIASLSDIGMYVEMQKEKSKAGLCSSWQYQKQKESVKHWWQKLFT